jgi:hypothetical protein
MTEETFSERLSKRQEQFNRLRSGKATAKLTPEGKEHVAVALLLFQDYCSAGSFNPEVILECMILAQIIGVYDEFEATKAKMPTMIIKPKA